MRRHLHLLTTLLLFPVALACHSALASAAFGAEARDGVHSPGLHFLGPNAWMLAAPVLLCLYYFIAWLAVGRDPKPGPIVTQYEPPQGLSAAALRWIVTTGSDGRSLAAAIAALACRGCLRAEPENGKYKLSRMMSDRATEAKLAAEEKRLLKVLFEDGPEIELTPSLEERNTAQLGRYVFHIQEELRKQLDGKYFARNIGVIAIGVLATFALALILAAMAHGRDAGIAPFFTMWLLFTGLTIGMMIEISLVSAWRTATRVRTGWIKMVPSTLAMGVFVAVIAYMVHKLALDVSTAFALMLAGFLLVNLIWAPLLKRRTAEGQKVLDEIAGFRMFLEKVDQDRLDKLNPADEMLQAQEQYLPYAIALEVREAWGDHLAQTFFATTTMR